MPDFMPSRLAVARRIRGLYQKELAQRLDVSEQYISQLERGKRDNPSDELVEKMSFVLRFPIGFFSGSHIELMGKEVPSFRARRSMTAKVRDAALARNEIAAHIISSDLNSRFNLPETDIPDLAEVPEVAAQLLRDAWRLGEGPIHNMVHLLESKGVEVYWLNEEAPDMDALSFWRDGQPFVFLNANKDKGDRSRFDVAHELGHLVLHRHKESLQGAEIEKEANVFAGSFLLPAQQFRAEAPNRPDCATLIRLKKRWKVSIGSMVVRSHQLGIYSDWQYRHAYTQISKKGWRKDEPVDIPREQSRLHMLIFEQLENKDISPSAYARSLQLRTDDLLELMPVAEKCLPDKAEQVKNIQRGYLRLVNSSS